MLLSDHFWPGERQFTLLSLNISVKIDHAKNRDRFLSLIAPSSLMYHRQLNSWFLPSDQVHCSCLLSGPSHLLSTTCRCHLPISLTEHHPGAGKLWLPVWNRVLLKRKHAHLFLFCLWLRSGCSNRVERLQLRPYGLNITMYLLPGS